MYMSIEIGSVDPTHRMHVFFKVRLVPAEEIRGLDPSRLFFLTWVEFSFSMC